MPFISELLLHILLSDSVCDICSVSQNILVMVWAKLPAAWGGFFFLSKQDV